MPVEDAKLSRAEELIAYLEANRPPFVALEGAELAEDGSGRVSLSLGLSIPQAPVVPIARNETIEIRFAAADERQPEVYATRSDFPKDLIHTTPTGEGAPVRLCLWEAAWPDVRRSLSPQALLARTREWFEKTADGTLHGEEQPLEPLLIDAAGTVVLPQDYREREGALRLLRSSASPGGLVAVLTWATDEWAGDTRKQNARDLEVIRLVTAPHAHRALTASPTTLGELAELLTRLGTDLRANIRARLNEINAARRARDIEALILIDFVKSKIEGGEPVAVESWAFFVDGGVGALAEACGFAVATDQAKQSHIVPILGQKAAFNDALRIMPLRVTKRLSNAQVRKLSGGDPNFRPTIFAIGAGAVGSHVIDHAARAGFGLWSIIDEDVVLPHNIPRFTEGERALGFAKAEVVSVSAGRRYSTSNIKRPFLGTFAEAGNDQGVEEDIAAADLAVDFTASPATLGALVDHPTKARRASAFFGPSGRDAVLLLEDAARTCRLDALDAQYFAAVAANTALADHLDAGRQGFVRYSNACNDVSRPLHPTNVAVLSALLARALERGAQNPRALIKIWRLGEDGAVELVTIESSPVELREVGGWLVTVSEACIARMRSLRRDRLPKETGGVLIGTVDFHRRVVHIVDALPAPSDSIEKRTSFVRGKRALTPTLDRFDKLTHGNLRYLGEWHSHPEGAKAAPSRDDEDLFAVLARTMGPTFEPYFMAICSDDQLFVRLGAGTVRADHAIALR